MSIQFYNIPGGKRVDACQPGTRVSLAQVQRGGRLIAHASGSDGADVFLLPGQFLKLNNAAVAVAFGEPIKVSSGGFDCFLLRRGNGRFVLADAPVLFPVTRTIELTPGTKLPVHGKIFKNSAEESAEICFKLANCGQDFIIEEAGIPQGLKVSYLSGGNYPVEKGLIAENLSLLTGMGHIQAQVMGLFKERGDLPLRRMLLAFDPETGLLKGFVPWSQREQLSSVCFEQNKDSQGIIRHSFFPNEAEIDGCLRYVMECTANFYNHLRAD